MLDNADPLLGAAWHAVTDAEVSDGHDRRVRLLGEDWTLRRRFGEVEARDRRGVRAAAVAEAYGLLWLAVQPPLAGFPELPEMTDPGFATGRVVRETHVSAGVLTDNFLDVSHFSYLHAATFGRLAPVTTDACEVARDGWCLTLRHSTDLREGAAAASGPGPGSPTWRIATYTVLAPYVTHLTMHFPTTGERSAATLVCTPEDHDRTIVRVLVAWDAGDPAGLAAQVLFSGQVLDEDLRILERMADPRLALDLRRELHTRADRASVEYRRLVSDHLLVAAGEVPAA